MFNYYLLLKIAAKIFKRDSLRGELLVLIFVMSIVMASVSTIFLIIDRIETATASDVSDVLGADLVISSPTEIDPEWLIFAKQQQLKTAKSIEFSSVLFANNKMQLSSIKAISNNYPLIGSLEIANSPYAKTQSFNQSPPVGKVWLEPRILSVLGLTKGKMVELGYSDLQVAGVLMRQPGQGSTLFNIAPTALMNIDDLAVTKIIQPGSRVNYRYLFVGEAENIKIFAEKIKHEKNNSQRLVTVFDESPFAGSALLRSKKYIALSSLLTMILVGLTIALSANRYALKQFDTSALMRCFGMNNKQVLTIFMTILLFVCAVGVLLGGLFGIAFESLLFHFFSELLGEQRPSSNYNVLIYPVSASVIMLFGFSLPALLRLKQVSPMRVLRRQLEPIKLSGSIVYIIAIATLIFVMWLQMGDIKLLLTVMVALSIIVGIFSVIAIGLLKLFKRGAGYQQNAAINFSLRQLDANKGVSLLHLLAFSISLFVIALIILIKSELISKWQQSLGANTPNHFMVNVKRSEVEPLKTFFKQNQLEFAGLYPMVRGRIVGINGEDVKTAVPESGQRHNSLMRELNMTWTNDLPLGNHLVEGQWQWDANLLQDLSKYTLEKSSQHFISIEERTAKALGIEIGDVINFSIGSEPWDAQVVNIRFIDWQTFTPNFYIISNPNALNDFNATYMTSFYLDKTKKHILPQLANDYPSVTVIELDLILEEIQVMLSKVSRAIEMIMFFVIAAGVALLLATMGHTFDNKYKQSAILRTLGASKKFIALSFRFEYFWLALLSSVLALIALEAISYLLYTQVFDIAFQFHWQFWWIMPMGTLFIMLLASWRDVNKITHSTPLSLIR